MMNVNNALAQIENKICLVTGGAGSIGSELCRRLRDFAPKSIVAADVNENGLYELITDEAGIDAEIASVRDEKRMEQLFGAVKPDIVFHAAAHKHVPFMEMCPEEAVKNNIRGTQITARMAVKYGAEKFVLISTDKAVEPASVMGASKRVCEMLVYEMSRAQTETKLCAVRFGNVIGSSGSVIPLFKKQIRRGTVTVTDRDVTRYFMTVERAARLVIDAASVTRGGEIFIPEMGESVNIAEMARRMIDEEGAEADIVFTGLRRGDKLHEKLFYAFEKREESGLSGVYMVRGSSVPDLTEKVQRLYDLAADGDRDGVRAMLTKITGGCNVAD